MLESENYTFLIYDTDWDSSIMNENNGTYQSGA